MIIQADKIFMETVKMMKLIKIYQSQEINAEKLLTPERV